MTLAKLPALPGTGVAPVPLTVDDEFYEYAREHSLPDCSVSFLMRAGSWSARNSRSGFVPSSMLADFSDDPDLVTRTLHAAGLAERVKGGIRITGEHGITVINAADVEQEIARKRAADAERQRKSRANRKAAAVQARAAPVTVMSHVTSHDTPPSDDQDLDLNQSGVKQVNHHQVRNARAREPDPEPGTPAFRVQVAAEFAGSAGIEIDDAAADAIAADVLGTRNVPHKLSYVRTAIQREKDPYGRWLAGRAPARRREREWCGNCDPEDRTLEDEQGRVYKCPECTGFAASEAS